MFRVAIIGSGPGGFYTAQSLLKGMPNVEVDIFDKLPVPFGLVRYGIAPDHQDAKNVRNSFTDSFEGCGDRARFFGNIEVNTTCSDELNKFKSAYDKVILATGLPQAKKLNIPGEDDFIVPAKNFVEYYNGYPGTKSAFNLSSPRKVIIIGNGNVSLDCARVLLCPNKFESTDIASEAYKNIRTSGVQNVDIIARRGIVNTAFTIKEFRDLTKLLPISVQDKDLEHSSDMKKYSRKARMLDLIRQQDGNDSAPLTLRYLRKPIEATAEGLVVSIQRVVSEEEGTVEDTGNTELIPGDQILSSAGYFVPNRPKADPQSGLIDGEDRLHTAGWLKFGPKGTVLAAYADSKAVTSSLISDLQKSSPSERLGVAHPEIEKIISDSSVSWEQWKRIKSFEDLEGKNLGKVSEKITSVEQMMRIAKSA